jgi:hypothetical protein
VHAGQSSSGEPKRQKAENPPGGHVMAAARSRGERGRSAGSHLPGSPHRRGNGGATTRARYSASVGARTHKRTDVGFGAKRKCCARPRFADVQVCIHRGTKQIGGTCVEIDATGSRIIVDLGLPLDAVESESALVPQISGLREHDHSLLGIIISHGHRDHWGLIPKVRSDIPILMGQAAEQIM